jgi:methanogenic corrinoid protein MtbC1
MALTATVKSNLVDSYIETLLTGDRSLARQMVEMALTRGATASELLNELVWPVMERVQGLYKDDQITISAMNMATRLNRSLTDQLTAKLERKDPNGKKVLIFCGDDEPEELGGQICADLFEAEGWTVKFAGGGVPNDEVLKMIGDERPNLLVMFATLPGSVPNVRKLIDYLRDVNCCPEMQVMCCGGIYKRAEGLAEEIGADLYAADAAEAVETATAQSSKRASLEQQTVGRTRRIKKAAARRIGPGERKPAGDEMPQSKVA